MARWRWRGGEQGGEQGSSKRVTTLQDIARTVCDDGDIMDVRLFNRKKSVFATQVFGKGWLCHGTSFICLDYKN